MPSSFIHVYRDANVALTSEPKTPTSRHFLTMMHRSGWWLWAGNTLFLLNSPKDFFSENHPEETVLNSHIRRRQHDENMAWISLARTPGGSVRRWWMMWGVVILPTIRPSQPLSPSQPGLGAKPSVSLLGHFKLLLEGFHWCAAGFQAAWTNGATAADSSAKAPH